MKRNLLLAAVICLLGSGCSSSTDPPADGGSRGQVATEGTNSQGEQGSAATGSDESPSESLSGGDSSSLAESNLTPVAIQAGTVVLSPENTMIQFVGKHTDQRPDRTGVFQKFQGTIEVDASAKTIKSISVEIEAASLIVGIDRLTNHLRSADFFEVDEFPTAKFQSTDISAADAEGISAADAAGQYQVTGKLELHGVEKEVTFLASATFSEAGLTLRSEFLLDRTDFGMDWGPDVVKNEISMTVVVGEKTQPPQSQRFGGGGRRGGRRGGGRGFDPAARFKEQDADSDGRLTEDEMPERMRDRFATFDADGDGALTLVEFQQGFRQIMQGRGGRRSQAERPDGDQ